MIFEAINFIFDRPTTFARKFEFCSICSKLACRFDHSIQISKLTGHT